jgi:uncharacterized protein YbcV (DUF1398 family)
MFTIQQIEDAHSKVKSGADFPKYIQDIKQLGVMCFETYVFDCHTTYFGQNDFQTKSQAQYNDLIIADKSDKNRFLQYLKIHQQGETNYLTFCGHCAETGVEKWIVDIDKLTCVYYDKAGNELLAEVIPTYNN